MFDEEKCIELYAYNIETILAEKVETVLRRSVFSTRIRDLYDIYILSKTQAYDKNLFIEALSATAKHRETVEQIMDITSIVENIENSEILKTQWKKYQREYAYAKEISYEEVVIALKEVLEITE